MTTPTTSPTLTLVRRLVPAFVTRPGRRAAWRRARARRWFAAALVGMAVWLAAAHALPDRVTPGVPVVVASRDIPAGTRLGPADVLVAHWPVADRPASALADVSAAVGQLLAGPASRGEPLTPARLRGPGLLVGRPPGEVGAHVMVTDPAVTAMVHVGDSVDVLSTADGAVVASAVTVLAVDAGAGDSLLGGGSDSPAGVVVAVSTVEASAIARAAGAGTPAAGLSLTLRQPPL